MKPCTSINLFFDASFKAPVSAQIERCARAGFEHPDMNFRDWSRSDASPFEAHNFVRKLPENLKDEALALQYRIGLTLVKSIQ